MKKLALLIVITLVYNTGFGQELLKLNINDIYNNSFIENNNMQDFKFLATKAEVGVAYLSANSIKKYNSENGIKLIRINSDNLTKINTTLDFKSSVEMIIIDVKQSNFNLENFDCSILKQFQNLKYIYYRYLIDIKNKTKLPKLNCLPINVKQYYIKQFAS